MAATRLAVAPERIDLEIAIPRSNFADVRRAFTGFDFFTASNGTLTPTPPTVDQHQNWVLDPIARVWRVDIFLEPGDDATWIYRRDSSLQLPRAQTFAHTADGIPYLRPELVLLFKAKATRPKDELDFATALPTIDRAWLHGLLRFHPTHGLGSPRELSREGSRRVDRVARAKPRDRLRDPSRVL